MPRLMLAVLCPLDFLGEFGIYFLLLFWNMRERKNPIKSRYFLFYGLRRKSGWEANIKVY